MEIPPLEHHLGSTERAFVAHINDLNDFYLQREGDRTLLLQLGKELFDEYSESFAQGFDNSQQFEIGDYCVCPSESEDWYRGLIRHIDTMTMDAWIYRIDYGDVQQIPLQYLRPLKEHFFSYYRMAYNCSLAHLIKPLNGWPKHVIDEFQKSLSVTFLYAKIISYNPIRNLCEVELQERNSSITFNKNFKDCQDVESSTMPNDSSIYRMIPMDNLPLMESMTVNILYYLSPTRFYVYLPERIEDYNCFHKDLQQSMPMVSGQPILHRHYCVAVRDQQMIWHRAIILEIFDDSSCVLVFFIDLGFRELVPVENIQSIPKEFLVPAAVAIPCRLFRAFPPYEQDQSIWRLDDKIHEEFHRLTSIPVECMAMNLKEKLFYDVSLNIPNIGDLCDFFCQQKLASSVAMNSHQQGQRTLPRFGLADNRFAQQQLHAGGMSMNTSNIRPQSLSQRTLVGASQVTLSNQPTALLSRNPPSQQLQGISATNNMSMKIATVQPENGKYTITQIHSPTEFYGYSAKRESELNALRMKLEEDYNNKASDPTNSNFLVVEDEAYVIQMDNKCERVILKSRDTDTKVRVKLVDRGDEIVLDTSELLPLNRIFEKIPVFAQRFRLSGYDESKNSATMTKNFKQMILNKTVDIKLIQTTPIHGSYVVEVSIEGHVLNDLPLGSTNMTLPPGLVTALTSPVGRSGPTNPQTMAPITSHVFTNSSRYQTQNATQPSGPRATGPLNLNNPLNTNTPRTQPGRFGDQSSSRFDQQENQSTHTFSAQTSQQPSRFATPAQQQNPPQSWNNDNNSNSNTGNFGGSSASNFSQNAPSSNSYNQSAPPTEQKRSFDNSGFGRDFQNVSSNRTNNFSRFNESASNNDNPSSNRNGQGFSSNPWNSQNNNNDNERGAGPSNPSSSDNFSGSSGRGFPSRGYAHQGSDRPAYNRFQSNEDSNNDNRQSSRGGFSNSRGQSNQGPDRPAYNRFQSNEDSNNDNRQSSRGGFSTSRGQTNQGPDRSSYNRFQNNDDSNNDNRQSSRGGFSNNRGQSNQGSDRPSYNRFQNNEDSNNDNRQNFRDGYSGGRNDFSRRYDDNNNRRDNQSRGDFSDRGGRGGGRGSRGSGGGRGGFDNRGQGEFRQSFDNKDSSNNSRDSFQSIKVTISNVEVGTHYPDNVMLTNAFEYVISHVEKPDEFFIQLTANENEITSTSEVLQREWNECPDMDLSSLKLNEACLAKHQDGCWYRAMIISTSTFQPKVRFIDFGDTTVVTGPCIRKIAKKHCLKPPYAYRCTFADITVSPNADVTKIIEQCVQKTFQGKIVGQTGDKRFILQSDQFQKILIDTNSITVKVEVKLPRQSCSVVQIENSDHQFFIQDDLVTVEKIAEIVEKEWESAPMLSIEEVKELPADTMIMALFEDVAYRAVIRQEENENDVKVYFVDYGNTDITAKTSLKRCSDELSKYASQAKRCQLFGIPSAKLDEAFTALESKTDSESIEYSLVQEKDQCLDILIYIEKKCFNEQFGCDLSTVADALTPTKKVDKISTPVEQIEESLQTTVEVKEEPIQTSTETNEESSQTTVETKEETIPITTSTNEEMAAEPTKEEEQEQVETASTTRHGLLTHMEKDRAYVYIQMLPDSEEKLEQIIGIINAHTENPKPISDCQIGDLVIARFTDDENYYRARIQSFSAESNSYSVYFIDFGNIDENVSSEYILSYPDELKVIEPQVHAYLLNEINGEQWKKIVQPFLESEKLNGEVEFDLIDEQSSIIHLHDLPDVQMDVEEAQDEQLIDPVVDEKHEVLSGFISAVGDDCFYFQSNSSGINEMDDMLKTLKPENRTDDQWSVGDRCLVVDDENRLYRGEIISISQIEDNSEYTVKCFDYGSTQTNRKGNQLFLLPDEEIFRREPLAHQCRLQSIDDDHQRESVERIPSNELIRIEIENDRNASCWCVSLHREEQIEEESDTDKNEEIVASDAVQVELRDEQNSMSVISNNQTIDFGEHDPSTTTIQDETQNESVPPTSN